MFERFSSLSPLHHAIIRNRSDVVIALLAAGAVITAVHVGAFICCRSSHVHIRQSASTLFLGHFETDAHIQTDTVIWTHTQADTVAALTTHTHTYTVTRTHKQASREVNSFSFPIVETRELIAWDKHTAL